VGEHPIFPELLSDAKEIAAAHSSTKIRENFDAMQKWDAVWFTDQCCGSPDAATTELLLEIQRREWALLFNYNFGKAFA